MKMDKLVWKLVILSTQTQAFFSSDEKMLRNIFAYEDEDPDWQEVLAAFPTKVPRFDTKDEAIQFTKNHCQIGSNPDYPNLQHSITTLVDWKQIEKYLLPKIQEYDANDQSQKASVAEVEETMSNNRYRHCEREEDKALRSYICDRLDLKVHKSLSYVSRYNTLRYLFFHMKCGIYVMIRDNALKIFAPFVNKEYENTWGDHPHLNCSDGSVTAYTAEKARSLKYKEEKLLPKNKWWANGNIICNTYISGKGAASDQVWGDHFLLQLKDMFGELCRARRVPDCEFFINKRDYPQMKVNADKEGLVEPYGFIFDRDDRDPKQDLPLERHAYRSYLPVLSFYLSKRFADIPIPPTEDWEAATGKVYPASFKFSVTESRDLEVEPPRDLFTPANLKKFERPWEAKVPTAFFRGTATGGGVTGATNQRIRIAEIHHEWHSDLTKQTGGHPYLDAKITGWNARDKKIASSEMTYVLPKSFPFDGRKSVNFVPIYEQSQYKYLLYVEGHCAACRYGFMMSLGSVILKVDSTCVADQMWYFPLLQPFVDHVPIKADYSDLLEKLEWCHTHDAECAQIAANAKAFYEKYISREGILDYLQCLCVEIARRWQRLPAFLAGASNSTTTDQQLDTPSPLAWHPRLQPSPSIPPKFDKKQLLAEVVPKYCAKAKQLGMSKYHRSNEGGILCTYCGLKIAEMQQAEKRAANEQQAKRPVDKEKIKNFRKRTLLLATGNANNGEGEMDTKRTKTDDGHTGGEGEDEDARNCDE